jgi:hypothetical protein
MLDPTNSRSANAEEGGCYGVRVARHSDRALPLMLAITAGKLLAISGSRIA